ncbi:MAG: dTMP kinase [Alphaproteobacteria bacterium]|nr:dTMP kinase [Alphaproteobacteria bacterium]MBT5389808.1 dTMP kinase [Alphaproteobacteria bacterium]MBT5540220.1 dTMP kinase [Alphaproteobacteria bacterium]
MANRGKFITFEGGEGSGKSTQITLLAQYLKDRGKEVLVTREPGGTPGAEEIRPLILTGEPGRWDSMTELLLYFAARRDHLEKKIKPALAAGTWVLSDRFADSSLAYQGYAGDLGKDIVEQIIQIVVGDSEPDLTFIFDLSSEVGLKRAMDREELNAAQKEDRLERKGADYHEKVRDAYQQIAKDHSDRCVLLDADKSIEDISQEISQYVDLRLGSALKEA